MIIFTNYDQYEKWTEQFENCSDYEGIPTAIDDGWGIATDMFTECKSWKTALRRFKKTFSEVNPEIAFWVECMRESCESGYYHEAQNIFPQGGTYSWGVEETMEGYWYVFLNISGVYAGRKARA